jgi:FKBP-type peptidyl-prolyl cis-trans isomerase 2
MVTKGDFIEINYTGKTSKGIVFDTTHEDVAKKSGLNPAVPYKPARVCIGQNQLLAGLEKGLEGKEPGTYTVEITAEDAFGKKDTKLIQLIPTSKFTKDKLNPVPGLQVNIDGQIAVIKRVSGGRVLVDFNHPLAGVDLVYDVEIIKTITDTQEKLETYVNVLYGPVKTEFAKETGVATLYVKTAVPDEVANQMKDQFIIVIPEIKDVVFALETKSEDLTTDMQTNKKEEPKNKE